MAKKLGELLVERGLLTTEQLTQALAEQQRSGEFLGTVAVRLGFLSEPQLLDVLSQQFGLPFVNLRQLTVDPAVVRLVPAKFVSHHKVMPVHQEGKTLTVAIRNPLLRWPLDELALQLGMDVEPVLASESDIVDAIHRYYGVGAETVERILAASPEAVRVAKTQEKAESIEATAEDASVVRLVNEILREAVRQGATDIHIEPFRDEMALRYRVDGRLYDTPAPADLKYLYSAIVSRIKIIAGLDIIERRMPQDGRARIRVGEEELDLRVSVLPTLYGENLAIRLLSTSQAIGLDKLGFSSSEDLKTLERLIALPHGIIFVTGPTGSGKTTTLYACLTRLNTRDRNIVTIEDPIEYELRGTTQIPVNAKIDLTFARALRNVLRHDPNVLMVGEVRDRETAEITIQAALTGHLVFSTLHTNDAVGAIARLMDMGIEPYLLASSVEGFIAQRLVRLICRECREEVPAATVAAAVKMTTEELEAKTKQSQARGGLTPEKQDQKGSDPLRGRFVRGKGCAACRQTGYRGRTAIYEILVLDPELKAMIVAKASTQEIKQQAIQRGMQTLLDDGWRKVAQGLTTLEEVLRVTSL